MRECPAIIAALPREVKALVRGWRVQRVPGHVLVFSSEDAVVACAGIGGGRAALAVQAAMAVRKVTALVSVGLAGACDPALRVGDVVRPAMIVDAQTGERFGSGGETGPPLVSMATIAGVREKQRLAASYGASVVDMEAASVARLARAHGLAFRAIKSISDEADFEMQELGRFATPDGQFRETAFAAYAVSRPWMWPRLAQLAKNSARAVRSLTVAVETELDLDRQET